MFDELASDANRKKIAVTRSDGVTQCYVEIERWDDANETAWLHTRIHTVSALQDGYLYLYYDSDHADNDTYVGDVGSAPGKAVWDDNFKLVAHLGEDPTGGQYCIKDSTSNENHGTPYGTMTSGDLVDGQFGKCLEFDATDDFIFHGSSPNLDSFTLKTIELIADPQSYGLGNTGKLVTKGLANLGNTQGWFLMMHSSYSGIVYHCCMSGNNGFWSMPFTMGSFQSIGVTYDNTSNANDPLMYIDGVSQEVTEQVTPTGTVGDDGASSFTIGGSSGNYVNTTDGPIDEVRYSNIIRSAAWLKATHKGLFDDLLIFSTEQSSSSSSESTSVSSSSSSASTSVSGSISDSSSSSESTSQSSSSESSESVSSSSISVSFSSSSSSYDPTVYATVMAIELTMNTPSYFGSVEASTMSIEFVTGTATYPLYGRMGQPVTGGSKPKAICEGSKAYVDFKGRDAKILMSGY